MILIDGLTLVGGEFLGACQVNEVQDCAPHLSVNHGTDLFKTLLFGICLLAHRFDPDSEYRMRAAALVV